MELRFGHVAFSAASTPQQGEESQARTGSATSLGPSTLPSQILASEALRIIDADIDDDTELLAIADTLVSLGAPPTYQPPPLPVQPQQGHSAPSPAGTGQMPDLTLVASASRSSLRPTLSQASLIKFSTARVDCRPIYQRRQPRRSPTRHHCERRQENQQLLRGVEPPF